VVRMIYQALGCGVTRSKRQATQWMRKAAECGFPDACMRMANKMYMGLPYAREVGHVGEATGVTLLAGVMQGHDVPPDVLTSVMHWLQRSGDDPSELLDEFRREALEGGAYCRNDGCEVVRLLQDFKVCPQCKSTRYCGAACQKEDWATGGHKEMCGTSFAFTKHFE